MILSSTSISPSWLTSTPPAPPAPASPFMTLAYSTQTVSLTKPTLSASSPTTHNLITIPYWGTRPYLEEAIAFDMNPYATDEDEPYYTYSRKESQPLSLYSRCGLPWRTSFFEWLSTAVENSTLLDEFTCFKTATHNPVWDCWNATGDVALVTTLYNEAASFQFTATPPCCGGCTFTAGDVQVYHWPIRTTSPVVSLLVNSQGFTFTYPSVYVAFETIAARDLCGVVGSAIKHVTTIGFDASELSTAPSYYATATGPIYGSSAAWVMTRQTWWTYSAIDWEDNMNCTEIVTSVWTDSGNDIVYHTNTFIETIPAYTGPDTTWATYTSSGTYLYYGLWSITYNPCTPFLSIPSQIVAIDPLWSTCYRDFNGLHDPPILLTPSNGFLPVKTQAPEFPADETPGASAGQAVPQPIASKTASQKISALPATFRFGNTVITANFATIFVIGTQSLAPGQKITESGTLLSLASDGRELVIGSSTETLDPGYIIGTQTLRVGGSAVTVNRTALSLISGNGGDSVVVGGILTEDGSVLTGAGLGRSTSVPNNGGEAAISGWEKIRVGVLLVWSLALLFLGWC